uniref:Craniofacial development protein 2-like n=1 Tax=Plectus sambesii TaxID=2011161 RepID=A0A914VK43_9BILA
MPIPQRQDDQAVNEGLLESQDDLEEEINKRSTYLVIMGDFNTKVGCRQDDETFIRPFGGNRNKQEQSQLTMELDIPKWHDKK